MPENLRTKATASRADYSNFIITWFIYRLYLVSCFITTVITTFRHLILSDIWSYETLSSKIVLVYKKNNNCKDCMHRPYSWDSQLSRPVKIHSSAFRSLVVSSMFVGHLISWIARIGWTTKSNAHELPKIIPFLRLI